MYQCYRCNADLIPKKQASAEQLTNKAYRSKEHVIPSAIHGHLTSDNLLCKGCNEELGELDAELSKQLIISHLVDAKKDRTRNKRLGIHGRTEKSKIDVWIGPKKWNYVKPQVEYDKDGNVISISRVKSLDEAEKILEREKKRNPSLNVSKFDYNEYSEYLEERVNFSDRKFGGRKVHRAIAKIAVNFYLSQSHKQDQISDMISYVVDGGQDKGLVTFYFTAQLLNRLTNKELSHIIYLRGDNKSGLCFCYIELYNVINFIVVLSEDYCGENFKETYCYDLIEEKPVEVAMDWNLWFGWVQSMKWQYYVDKHQVETQEYFTQAIDRFYRVHEFLQTKK